MNEPLPRRPLLVSHSGDPGGSNEVLLALLRHRPAGCEPTCVFLADGPAVAAAESLGVPVRLVRAGAARKAWRAPGIVRRLRREARRVGADLVFAHVAKAHAYASVAARSAGLPYLWWQHDLPRPSASGKLAARLPADAVVCSSDFTAELQRELGSSRVVRIHPGIELDGAQPAAVPGPVRPPVVGAVGRLRRYKRYELLLAAAPLVLAAAPETQFVIAGGPTVDSDYPGELASLARSLGIEQAVAFAGHVDGAAARMRELDLLVHTAELEPFGLVVAEALLHGVPVVGPAAGGPAEIVRHGVDGLLVDVEDADALAGAVLELVGDPARRERMGREGSAHVRSAFSAERMAQAAWELARRVAAREAGRA